MAITKIQCLNEAHTGNPAAHLKNALSYIQNPEKTEENVLVGSINCLLDTAFEQMMDTKVTFGKTDKRQGYHIIISFAPGEATEEQALDIVARFAQEYLKDKYEAVYAVHNDKKHMHGHIVFNSVSFETGMKHECKKGEWKHRMQPITNRLCKEYGLSIVPAEYVKEPKNLSRKEWEREQCYRKMILADAEFCQSQAGSFEHFVFLMKRIGYQFEYGKYLSVKVPGGKWYHELDKLDERFSEEKFRFYLDMPFTRPVFVVGNTVAIHKRGITDFQMKYYRRINVSPDITLTGNDSINDLLHDYEDDRDELEKVLEDCDKTANEHVYVNILKDEYSNKYALMKKEIEGMFDTVEKSISENFKEISKQLDKKVLESKSIIYRLSPTEINIDLLSEEETIKRMEELDIVLNSVRQEYENVYFPFIKQFENITFEKDYTKTLEAYKSKEIELTKQIDSFYELAQIGMSIEVIDHQFNVLYAQIASALSKLGDMSKKSSEVLEIYNPLKMSFQHLESNHKMLMPMYRTTRRNKTNISGRDIVEVIDNFYGKVLKRDGIEFVYSEEFANYTIYSFESIIMPVFLNIINNAIYWVAYGNERKRIEIKIRDNEILIMNSGAKMSYTELTRCFEIFYTKKASGRGIGLYLAKKCLNSIDMDIYATNDKEYNILDGACFVICQHEGE